MDTVSIQSTPGFKATALGQLTGAVEARGGKGRSGPQRQEAPPWGGSLHLPETSFGPPSQCNREMEQWEGLSPPPKVKGHPTLGPGEKDPPRVITAGPVSHPVFQGAPGSLGLPAAVLEKRIFNKFVKH